jgi:serine/threonine protein kinase
MDSSSAEPRSASAQLAADAAHDMSGRTLGDFRLLRRLGQGGMGQVYLAEQISLKRNVAIKIMRPEAALDPVSFQRFRAEAEAVARVSHANIVQVYAFGEFEGQQYMALEYVEGRSLGEHLRRKGTTELPLALSIMRQVSSGLQRAAELGVVHRDIKPENILMTRRGEVKIADFGLSHCFDKAGTAKLTQPGIAVGTPLYMSPEQIEGKDIDPRTDIYSFGATSYHMLAGVPPFAGDGAYDVAMQHLRGQAKPLSSHRPDLPAELCRIVHKMMTRPVGDRYQTCRELQADLSKLRAAQKVGASVEAFESFVSDPSISAMEAETPSIWRQGLPYMVGTSLLVALFAGGALGWRHNAALARNEEPPTPHVEPPAPPRGPIETEQQKQEQDLRKEVDRDSEPGNDRFHITRGVTNRIDLASHYLHLHRLDDADRFFAELQKSRVKVYAVLGKLGHAIVLAHQDKPAESDRLFMELLGKKGLLGEHVERIRLLMDQPMLRYEIARALDANKVNATPADPFPLELETWRVAPDAGRKKAVGAGK